MSAIVCGKGMGMNVVAMGWEQERCCGNGTGAQKRVTGTGLTSYSHAKH